MKKGIVAAVILIVIVLMAAILFSQDESRPESLQEVFRDFTQDDDAATIMTTLNKRYESREPLQVYRHRTGNSPEAIASAIRESGFKVREYPGFPMDAPVDWATDPHKDANWRYQLNALYPGIVYVEAYSASGKREWFDAALALFLDWIAFNLEEDRENAFKWYDMATGLRAIYLAVLLDHGLRDDYLTVEEFERLALAASEHVTQLHKKQRLASNNHGLFQVAGIAALCAALPDIRACMDAEPYANKGFERLFALQFNAEGMHLEHSPEYHHLGLNVIDGLVDMGWFELTERQRAALAAAKSNFHWLMKPDRTYPVFGDTGRPVYRSVRRFHPTLEYLVSGGSSGQRPPGGVKLFPDTGYAFARHYASPDAYIANAYLAMTVAHHSVVHKHADAFSFEWFDGRSLLVDSGKWGYDEGAERDYIVSTRAHNTVEIDGNDDSIKKIPTPLPELLGAVAHDNIHVLRARGMRPTFGREQQRLLVMRPGKWLIIADFFDKSSERYVQWFHAAEDFECHRGEWAEHGFRCSSDDGASFTVASLVPLSGSEHARGRKDPRMQGWLSPAYRVLVPADALGLVQERGARNFITLFHLEADDASVLDTEGARIDMSGLHACWTLDGQIDGINVEVEDDKLTVRGCNGANGEDVL